MKTKLFAKYRPDLSGWIDKFEHMRDESKSDEHKPAKAEKSTGKPNGGKKQIVKILNKMKNEYKMKQKPTEAANEDQPMVSAQFIQQIHSYALPPKSEASVTYKYKCPDCKFAYKTNKKSNFDYHFARCNKGSVNDLKCPICEKVYSYDTLRQHLRHFASGKHTTTNKHHKKYTPSDHLRVLDILKELKKK